MVLEETRTLKLIFLVYFSISYFIVTSSQMSAEQKTEILSIYIPSSKDLWLNIDSEKSYLSWYKVIKEKKGVKIVNKKYRSNRSNVIYDNKEWSQIFYKLYDDNNKKNHHIFFT